MNFTHSNSPNYPQEPNKIPSQPHWPTPLHQTSSTPCSKPYPHTHPLSNYTPPHFFSSAHKSWPSIPLTRPQPQPWPPSTDPFHHHHRSPPTRRSNSQPPLSDRSSPMYWSNQRASPSLAAGTLSGWWRTRGRRRRTRPGGWARGGRRADRVWWGGRGMDRWDSGDFVCGRVLRIGRLGLLPCSRFCLWLEVRDCFVGRTVWEDDDEWWWLLACVLESGVMGEMLGLSEERSPFLPPKQKKEIGGGIR